MNRRFVDTNVLLSSTATRRVGHVEARRTLESGFADRSLCLSGQVLREYLAVATRPAANNGLALPLDQALRNVQAVMNRVSFLEEHGPVRDALWSLLAEVPCSGRQIHDANIVATMLAHDVRVLLTAKVADFVRFGSRIEVQAVP